MCWYGLLETFPSSIASREAPGEGCNLSCKVHRGLTGMESASKHEAAASLVRGGSACVTRAERKREERDRGFFRDIAGEPAQQFQGKPNEVLRQILLHDSVASMHRRLMSPASISPAAVGPKNMLSRR